MTLPTVQKEDIFLMLPGKSLNASKLVSKQWRNFILYLWNTNKGRTIFERKLRKNWHFPMYRCPNNNTEVTYEILEQNIVVPFNGFIDCVSNHHIALRSWYSTPIEEACVAVYNLENHSWWKLENIASPFVSQNVFDDFSISLTEDFIAIRIPVCNNSIQNLLRVWSLKHKEIMYEEVISNMVYMNVDPFNDPNMLVLFSDYVQVLNFQNGKIRNSRRQASGNDYSYGSFHRPYILQVIHHIMGIENFKVWKYDEDTGLIQIHIDVPKVDEFLQYSLPDGLVYSIEEVVYINENFIMTSKVTLQNDVLEDGVSFFTSYAIQIVNSQGYVLKQHLLPRYNVDMHIQYYFHDKKFVVEIDDKIFIYERELKNLFERIENDEKNMLQMNQIINLSGRGNLMLSKVEGRNVIMRVLDSGQICLSIKSLNFWRK